MLTPEDELEFARRAEQIYHRIQSEEASVDGDEGLPAGVGSVLNKLASLRSADRLASEEDPTRRHPQSETELSIGRFRLSQFLGEGAHGVVYLADDTLLDRIVALKLPKPHVLFSPELRMRFLREARAASGLHHPHIVQIYDASESAELSFIASEYCSGGAVSAWLKDHKLAHRTVARLIADLSDAVEHAHENGILHRDIKPSNIQLSPAEKPADDEFPFTAKLADFGLAKAIADDENQTRTGELIGTVRYMAPEVMLGNREPSPAADVYALGIVIYEMLCGKVPFDGNAMAIFRMATESVPVDVARLCDAPTDLAAICMKSIEKDLDRRYASAAELAADLRRFLAGEQTVARPIGSVHKMTRWAIRHPAPATLLGVLVVGVLMGLWGLNYHNQRLNQGIEALRAQKVVSDNAREEAVRSAALADRRARLLAEQQNKMATSAYAADMNSAFQAFTAQLPRLTKSLLAQQDDSARQQVENLHFDPRGFEWSFLSGLVNPHQVVLKDQLQAPHVALSPLTNSLVLVSRQASPRVLNLENLDQEDELATLMESREVAICPRTGQVAIAHQTPNDEWQIAVYSSAGEFQRSFGKHDSTIESLVFSSAGNFIARGARYADIVISTLDGEEVAQFQNGSRNEAIAFSPDDRLFAFSAYDPATDVDSVVVVETENWSEVARLPIRRKDEVLCFSPDGRHLLVSSDYQIDVYSTQDFERKYIIDGARARSSTMAFSEDGSLLVATTTEGVLRWWECEITATPGAARGPLGFLSSGAATLHDGRINAIAMGRDHQVFTCGEDGRVVCTDLPCSSSILAPELNGHSAAHMRVSRRGHLVTALLDGRDVIVFPDGKRTILRNHGDRHPATDWLRRLAVAPDSSTFASFSDKHVAVAPLDSSLSSAEIHITESPLTDIEYVANDLLAILAKDQPSLALWTTDGRPRKQLQFPGIVKQVEVVPASESIVVAYEGEQDSSGELCVYDWFHERIVHHVPCTIEISSLTLSGDGSLIAVGSIDGVVELYAMPELRKLGSIDSQLTQRMWAVAFSEDGKTMATGGTRGRLQLWQVETGRCLGTLLDNTHAGIVGVAIESDESIVCAFEGGMTTVRRLAP